MDSELPNGVERQLTPVQQQNKGVIERLVTRNNELGGRLVLELGSGNDRFLLFRHTMVDPGDPNSKKRLGLMSTIDGFKVIRSHKLAEGNPDIAEGVVITISNSVGVNGDPQEWKFDNRTGQISYKDRIIYTERNASSEHMAELVDGDAVGKDTIEAIITHNRRVDEPEKTEPFVVDTEVAQNLDNLLS